MSIIRALVLCLGLAGTVIFTGAVIASWVTPHFISKTAREVIRYRVAEEINEKVDALGADFLVEKVTKKGTTLRCLQCKSSFDPEAVGA